MSYKRRADYWQWSTTAKNVVFGTVNVHQTMQACVGHRTRSIPLDRHIPSSRRDRFAQRGVSRLTRYNPSRRLLSRRMKWRSTVPTIARPSTYIPQVPPDTNPPGHGRVRAPRVPAGPLLGHCRDPGATPAHPEVRRASMHETRGEGTVRSQARLRTPPRFRTPGSPSQLRVQAGVGSRSRECPRGCAGGARTCPRFRVGGCTGELAG